MALPDIHKRQLFASEYALSGNASDAARKAGVPVASAHSMGYKWLRNPEVIEFVRKEIDCRLRDLAPIAVGVLQELMTNEATPPQTKLSAARDLLDRLGWVPPKRVDTINNFENKDLTQLTRQELEKIASSAYN